MPSKRRLMRQEWYPKPHTFQNSIKFSIRSANYYATIYPLVQYNESLPAPSTIKTHPENTSFSTYGASLCHPDSEVDTFKSTMQISMTKEALHTDQLDMINVAFMPIHMAFLDDYEALDDLSGMQIEDILEMQHNTTNRNGYALYNGNQIEDKYSSSGDLHADEPGLTTNQIEEVDFDIDGYYNALQYKMNAPKLKKVTSGLKWLTLTRNSPIRNIKIGLKSNIKKMNPYAYLGVLVLVPETNTEYQIPVNGHTSSTNHINVSFKTRYLE